MKNGDLIREESLQSSYFKSLVRSPPPPPKLDKCSAVPESSEPTTYDSDVWITKPGLSIEQYLNGGKFYSDHAGSDLRTFDSMAPICLSYFITVEILARSLVESHSQFIK